MEKTTSSFGQKLRSYMSRNGNKNVVLLIFYLILQTIFFSVATKTFLTGNNMENLVRQTAELGMVCIPLSMILITGNIDLSIGSVMGVCAISMAWMLKWGYSIPVVLLLGMAIGVVVGSINGFMVAKLHLAGIVVTIGTQVMLRGVCYILTGGRPVSGLPQEFIQISKLKFCGLSMSFLVMMVMFVIVIIIMEYTSVGVKIHAIGYNPKTSIYSGISADKIKFVLFLVSGAVAAIASFFMLMRFGSAESEFANGYDTNALTAVLLGGISISGGSGNMFGTLLGLIAVAMLKNGLTHMGMSSTNQQFILGLLIVISAIQIQKKSK